MNRFLLCLCLIALLRVEVVFAQSSSPATTGVPHLVNYVGTVLDGKGNAVTGVVGATFAIYQDQYGGSPLWVESQNLRPDAKGNYTVQLGSTTSEGLPLDLFASGEARWLGVRVNGGEEEPRVLLLSVPYALKAADAQTLGGLPASAFALATPNGSNTPAPQDPTSATSAGSSPDIGGSGTADYIPVWTDSGDLGNSVLYQTGTGSSAKIGINETKPLFTLDVNGQELVRGLFEMATQNYANKNKGYNSNAINLESSAFNSGTNKYTLNHFQWQAEPTGNNTSTPGATLNLLYGMDPNQPAETGLNIASNGQISFVSGQTFPGTGTVTSVGSGAGLTGGPITGSGTLSVATGGITNTMLQNSSLTVTANSPLSGGGSVSLGGSTSLGLKSCTNNQVLEYVSGAWTCTNLSAGTVTSVGLSAPSSDFTVSGSPVTTSGTLGLNWTVAPASADTANAIVKRDNLGGFNAGVILAYGVSATTPGGDAIDGTTSDPTADYSGVSGINNGAGAGVYGATDSSNGTYGVWGVGPTGVYGSGGVLGVVGSGNAYGVVGNGPTGVSGSGGGIGVSGSGTAYGVYGSGPTGVYGSGTTGNGVTAYNTAGGYGIYSYSSGYTAYLDGPSGSCDVKNGSLHCTGSKSAVVPVDGGTRDVALYAVEAPENWFEDFGSARLSSGKAVIYLEPTFAQTVNTNFDYHVFPVPNGDCKGLYVSEKSPTSFVVSELGGGKSNITFDYRIVARRNGYENIRLEDMTKDFTVKRPARVDPPSVPPISMPRVNARRPVRATPRLRTMGTAVGTTVGK